MTKNETGPGEHPLFRAMVVMGGSLAVGCGGTTAMGESTSGPHTGSGTGGTADMADAPGGSHDVASMDVPSAGGSSGTNTAGAGGKVSAVMGGAGGTVPTEPQCPSAQWSCDTDHLMCGVRGLGNFWELPSGCACDSTRPASAADCASDELFVCRQATQDAGGVVSVLDCACVPRTNDCSEACKAALSPNLDGYFQCDGPGVDTVLCGCAFVYLR